MQYMYVYLHIGTDVPDLTEGTKYMKIKQKVNFSRCPIFIIAIAKYTL